MGLNKFLLGTSRAAQIMSDLQGELGAIKGEMAGAVKIDTRGFDIPLEKLDMDSFNRTLEQGMRAMTAGLNLADPIDQAVNDRVERMAGRLRIAKFFVDEGAGIQIDIGGKIQNLLGLQLDKVGEDFWH